MQLVLMSLHKTKGPRSRSNLLSITNPTEIGLFILWDNYLGAEH